MDDAVVAKLSEIWSGIPGTLSMGAMEALFFERAATAGFTQETARAYLQDGEGDLYETQTQPASNARAMLHGAISEALGSAYDCTRVWSAWGCGTMGPDDFTLVAENDDRIGEIADAVLAAVPASDLAMRLEVKRLTIDNDRLRLLLAAAETREMVKAATEDRHRPSGCNRKDGSGWCNTTDACDLKAVDGGCTKSL